MAAIGKRERELATEIKAALALSKEAQFARSYAAALQAQTRVSNLRTELSRLKGERLAEAELDPLLRIQRLRRLATEAGSYTAAGALAKVELEMIEARALAAGAAGDGLDDATDEEILAVVVAAIQALPDTLVQDIAGACERRLSGAKLRVV
jgi:hypothetical protein